MKLAIRLFLILQAIGVIDGIVTIFPKVCRGSDGIVYENRYCCELRGKWKYIFILDTPVCNFFSWMSK